MLNVSMFYRKVKEKKDAKKKRQEHIKPKANEESIKEIWYCEIQEAEEVRRQLAIEGQ